MLVVHIPTPLYQRYQGYTLLSILCVRPSHNRISRPEREAHRRLARIIGGDICPLCDRSQFDRLADSSLRYLIQKTQHCRIPRTLKYKRHQIITDAPEYFWRQRMLHPSLRYLYTVSMHQIFGFKRCEGLPGVRVLREELSPFQGASAPHQYTIDH